MHCIITPLALCVKLCFPQMTLVLGNVCWPLCIRNASLVFTHEHLQAKRKEGMGSALVIFHNTPPHS